MPAYYNEIDSKAAAWLRELIKRGHIAPGEVDERSIEDVKPSELMGYTQCHFFAGIGVWSHALRQAGWPDDRPVWTGSCPCQPFSAAGKGKGITDERHLWPALYHLIRQCKPDVVFGEQVASKDGLGWLDIVQTDLEAARYSVGAVDLCAAGFGAPHIRQRLYWVADASNNGHAPPYGLREATQSPQQTGANSIRQFEGSSNADGMADAGSSTGKRNAGAVLGAEKEVGGEDGAQHGYSTLRHGDGGSVSIVADNQSDGRQSQQSDAGGGFVRNEEGQAIRLGRNGAVDGMADTSSQQEYAAATGGLYPQLGSGSHADGMAGSSSEGLQRRLLGWETARRENQHGHVGCDGTANGTFLPGPTNGFWGAADWLLCRDGKWRAVEPSTFPLVDGAPARVGRLRGYGNAIVAQVAQAFIEAYLDLEV